MGIDQISFLPADVSSHAFNREVLWNEQKQHEILPGKNELPELKKVLETVIEHHAGFGLSFIAEDPAKLRKVYEYYAAFYEMNPFPYKKCNAPWVSAVVEADGTVRPCFFHPPMGNIRKDSLENILNSPESTRFRKQLDMDKDNTCIKCVCYLNLSPGTNLRN
jgi:MoaA/NifB/PqqE/SkfB family radical SAM enzyme